ncbi:MAG: pyridoxal phosphate-dependent aminotransferase [Clostridia bacterium]|nr:pyridoxal phosphate-dependent aminotransferase [Clostridia bacterium]
MVSARMRELGDTKNFIREAFEWGRARAREIGPENVFDFSIGNPSVPPPKAVLEAWEALAREEPLALHGYTSTPGSDEARQAVADALNERFHTRYTMDAVTMTCGAAAALTACFKALTVDHETEFVAIAPYFPEYACFAAESGARFRAVPPDTEGFQIDFAALERALTPHTQAVIVNSPNNPSGAVYGEATLRRLAALLREKAAAFSHPIYLISDEPYRELYYGEAPLPFLPLLYEDTLLCYSYSKCFSVPGERIGYALLPDALTDCGALRAALRGALRAMGHVCAPSAMQKLAARCAGVLPDLGPYRKNRDLLYGALREMGYRAAPPMGAFYLFIEAPGGDARAFCARAREKDMLLVPGDPFGCQTHARISYCVPYERIERALPRFFELFNERSV